MQLSMQFYLCPTSEVYCPHISKLDPKKASIENDIPTKILIGSRDIVCGHLSNIYNNSKNDHKYPRTLKLADVTPIHKKDETTLLKNYRPVSLIPFERYSNERCKIKDCRILINYCLLTCLGTALSSALSSCWNCGESPLIVKALQGQY